ncbi:hypothetical protein SDC9_125832 [bioreactor metagenome]|uniref:Uncharacterized protein n=1 Tax=bioreactor metagenome TaxID=1076179 RepID=A0A645CPI2_9ZZZZ
MAVNREGRKSFLIMRSQRGGQINGPRTFCTVETPDSFRPHWIHVDGFATVAPAWGHCDGHAHIQAAEFFFAGGRFRHPGDTGVGNDTFNLRAAGVTKFLSDQRSGGFSHIHGLLFERFTNTHTAPINHRTNANFR